MLLTDCKQSIKHWNKKKKTLIYIEYENSKLKLIQPRRRDNIFKLSGSGKSDAV